MTEKPQISQESLEDLERVRRFVDTHEWHFAKTMPHIPHGYCLLKDKNDVDEFRRFAAHLRKHSKPGQFYGRIY